MSSYNEIYLSCTMDFVAEMFDVGINDLNIPADQFYDLFILSEYDKQIEEGNASIVCGKSGREMAEGIALNAGMHFFSDSVSEKFSRTEEYWAGWILAYLQFETEMSFRAINLFLPFVEIVKMYHPYHEMNEESALKEMIRRIQLKGKTAIQRFRKERGLSQTELARECNINLRTLQQYEAGNRDLRKASYETVEKIAKTLHCSEKDLCVQY